MVGADFTDILAGSREALNAGSYYQVAWVPEDNDDVTGPRGTPPSPVGVSNRAAANGPGPGTDDQGSVARCC